MRLEIIGLLAGMAVVTFLPRFFPMAFLTRMIIPEKVKTGLDYIPVAILSAIVFPVIFSTGHESAGIEPRLLTAAIPVFLFALKVRSLWGAVILGMLIYWGFGCVLGS